MPLKVVCSLKKKILTLLEDKKHQHTFNWVKFAVSKAVLLLPTQELLGLHGAKHCKIQNSMQLLFTVNAESASCNLFGKNYIKAVHYYSLLFADMPTSALTCSVICSRTL